MGGSSQSSASSSAASMAMRDADGFLPLSKCSLCGTRLIGRVSQQPRSMGKRFYKCPKLEHTPLACKFYMLEEHYVDYLATYGVDGLGIAVRGGNRSQPSLAQGNYGYTEVLNEANCLLKEAMDAIERCNVQLESATRALKEAEAIVKSTGESKMAMGGKIERIGERLVLVGLANIFLVVLVLLVLLVK
ncbi:unnamed protein product [Urochloa decumbens]|uniref:Zinc finger GRF-type domain-containing protein n=1 Tax=Urochloa decumbens TaxID=240449 RepID=A0ABC8WD57_9POAL